MKLFIILISICLCLGSKLARINNYAEKDLADDSSGYLDLTFDDFEEDEDYLPSELKRIIGSLENSVDNLPSTDENGRISFGQEAPVGGFPYQVGLSMRKSNGGTSWCGGVLISDQFVLTAAHCLRKTKSATVILGAHDRLNSTEPGQVRQSVSKNYFIVHPKYSEQRIRNDIALIRLADKLGFTPRIQPIALPDGTDTFDNQTGIVSGWGRYDSKGVLSRNLRYTQTTVVSSSVCKRVFGESFHSTNVCLDGSKAGSTCQGDSGGPFAVQSSNDGRPVLVGLVSFGSSRGCLKRLPYVMARVSSHLKWIAENTGIQIR